MKPDLIQPVDFTNAGLAVQVAHRYEDRLRYLEPPFGWMVRDAENEDWRFASQAEVHDRIAETARVMRAEVTVQNYEFEIHGDLLDFLNNYRPATIARRLQKKLLSKDPLACYGLKDGDPVASARGLLSRCERAYAEKALLVLSDLVAFAYFNLGMPPAAIIGCDAETDIELARELLTGDTASRDPNNRWLNTIDAPPGGGAGMARPMTSEEQERIIAHGTSVLADVRRLAAAGHWGIGLLRAEGLAESLKRDPRVSALFEDAAVFDLLKQGGTAARTAQLPDLLGRIVEEMHTRLGFIRFV